MLRTRITGRMNMWAVACGLLLNATSAIAQSPPQYPKDYFRSPLDIELSLSGNFGEIRPNHFHSGLDLRTNNREGLKVYAVADGYVSRIKVSPYGYGRALYITHPNGYVSLYGHLSAYNGAIAEYIKKAQYSKESFEVELFPAKDELKVVKGQIVAFTGNTGSSKALSIHCISALRFLIRSSRRSNLSLFTRWMITAR
jgi:murein DD-endopeptidase MepM/ murein hydrolase activator NlpD